MTTDQIVSISFIDDRTSMEFATTDMPVGNLPDTFEIDTTLHLGDDDWFVVHADPSVKEEIARIGSLTLRLRKVERIATNEISFSQVDITERFDDHTRLGKEDWIPTVPLNSKIDPQEATGLPPQDAEPDEIYQIASALSELRESIPIPDDGVYCPICHIANRELEKLRTPCPQCGRQLLKFGWT